MAEPAVGPAEWRLALADIDSGNGAATVTLRSGVQFEGRVDMRLSGSTQNTLFLRTFDGRGWHAIDWSEVAAITGVPYDSEA